MATDMVDREKVAQFKAKARVFQDQFARLKQRGDNVPEAWRADFDKLMVRGDDVKERIKAAAVAMDTSYKFATDTLGLPPETVNGLGIIPLIPLAFIAGSTAVTTYFVTDAQKFNAKMDELERLQEMGYTKEEAARIAERGVISVPAPVAAVWNNKPLRFVGLGLAGWLVYKKFLKPKLKRMG